MYRAHRAVGIEREIDSVARTDAVLVAVAAAAALAVRSAPVGALGTRDAVDQFIATAVLALLAVAGMVKLLRAPRWIVRFDPSSRVLEVRSNGLWPRSLSRVVIPPGSTLVREFNGPSAYLRFQGDDSTAARVTAPLAPACFGALADFVHAIEAVPTDAAPAKIAERSPQSRVARLLFSARIWAAVLALWIGWFAWVTARLWAR